MFCSIIKRFSWQISVKKLGVGQIKNRLELLDIFRGWAIILMVFYHLMYDLNYFEYITISMHHDTIWGTIRSFILFMFLFSVGMSLALVHHPKIKWKKVKKRTFLLGSASLLVTMVTFILFPTTWVYFGVLHFILVASLLGLLFLPYPRWTLLTIIFILIGSFLGCLNTHELFLFLEVPLHLPSGHTEDIVRFFPWFAVVLMGSSMISYGLHERFQLNTIRIKSNHPIAFLGRHTLLVYLIHQPILFGFFLLFN